MRTHEEIRHRSKVRKRHIFQPDCWGIRDKENSIVGIFIDNFDPKLLDNGDPNEAFASADMFDECVAGMRSHLEDFKGKVVMVKRETGEPIAIQDGRNLGCGLIFMEHTTFNARWLSVEQAIMELRNQLVALSVYDHSSEKFAPPYPGYDKKGRANALAMRFVVNGEGKEQGCWDSRFDKPLSWLPLSNRTLSFLDHTDTDTVGFLASQSRLNLRRLPGFDDEMLKDVIQALAAVDLDLGTWIWGDGNCIAMAQEEP
jgi:hypothetical protein